VVRVVIAAVITTIGQRQQDSLSEEEKVKNKCQTHKKPSGRVESSLSVIVYPSTRQRQGVSAIANNTASCRSAVEVVEVSHGGSHTAISNLTIRASVAISTRIQLCAS
jgi:hypothetical protein